jgi:hypothetical protein
LTLCFTATAIAAKIVLTVGPEPVESITTQLGAAVSEAGANATLWIKLKPSGGEGCAANPNADQGTTIIERDYAPEHAAAYSDEANHTFEMAGSYLVCGWVTELGGPEIVVASTSTSISVRRPHLALSISVPPQVLVGQVFQVATTAQAETARDVSEYLLPDTGDSCAANARAAYAASSADEIFQYWNVTGGPLTRSANESLTGPGTYLICAYFEYPDNESQPELATSATVTAVVPPPPCVVPSFGLKMKLTTVERRIRAGHCVVGKVEYESSKRVVRGAVIRLSPNPGTRLSAQAAVAIVVSTGRPKHHRRRR